MADETVLLSVSLVFVLSAHILNFALASHFRGGQLTWKPDSVDPKTVEFTLRLSWTLNFAGPDICDNSTIYGNTPVGPNEKVDCFKGCGSTPVTIGNTQVYCTEFSKVDNWMVGEKSFNYTFLSAGTFEVGFKDQYWIKVTPTRIRSKWSVVTTVDLRVRNDTGRVNSSPTMVSQPVVRINNNCGSKTKYISIPVTDADNDRTRCRWATGTDECEKVCNGLPMATLQQSPCRLSIPANQVTPHWYVVALMMEDFTPNSNIALSKVPLQFLVQGFQGSTGCAEPTFVFPTPPDGSVFHFDSNCPGLFQINVTARPGTPADSIVEMLVVKGGGSKVINKGVLHPLNNPENDSYSIISYQVPNRDMTKLISFAAKDQKRDSTMPNSVTVIVYSNSSALPNRCVNVSNCQYCGPTPPPPTTQASTISGAAGNTSLARLGPAATGVLLTGVPLSPFLNVPSSMTTVAGAESSRVAEGWRYYVIMGSAGLLLFSIIFAIVAYKQRNRFLRKDRAQVL